MNYMVNEETTNKDRKSINIAGETWTQLTKLGKWGESMDDIISKLIRRYNQK